MLTRNLWLIFIDGMLIAWYLRAFIVVRSSKNDYSGYGAYIRNNLAYFISRWFFAGCIFSLWVDNPAYKLSLTAIGLPFQIPLTLGTAGLAGYSADSVLDKILPILYDTIIKRLLRSAASMLNGNGGSTDGSKP